MNDVPSNLSSIKWDRVNHKASFSQSLFQHFPVFSFVIFFMELSSFIIEQLPKLDASVAATRKLFKIKEFADTMLVHVLAPISWKSNISYECEFSPSKGL